MSNFQLDKSVYLLLFNKQINKPGVFMQLKKSHDKMIAGVCGGIAEWQGWDPTIVRIVYVLVSVFSAAFPGILVYIILMLVMPPADSN